MSAATSCSRCPRHRTVKNTVQNGTSRLNQYERHVRQDEPEHEDQGVEDVPDEEPVLARRRKSRGDDHRDRHEREVGDDADLAAALLPPARRRVRAGRARSCFASRPSGVRPRPW